ncbi:MAG: ribosome small subunit-dependent GTPase A [Gemmatimonadales bacterium]
MKELGWTARLEQAFAPHRAAGLEPARVAVEHKSLYVLYTARGEIQATLTGRLRRDAARKSDLPAVGDWVAVRDPAAARGTAGRATIHAVLPRTGAFVRKAAGRGTDEQVVAANVDTVFVVTAVDGDVNARRLERYLALAWESGAQPVLVLSKADLEQHPADTDAAIAAVSLGVPTHRVSAVTGAGLADLRGHLAGGRTVALLGSSGVGKSTLVNALLGTARQAVAELRADGTGRHTTARRELIPLPPPAGGLLLDTPGMRELQLWEVDAGLAEAFREIRALAPGCRFRDCGHDGEPGCAVAAAVAAGTLPADRLASYRKLQAELRHLEARADPRAAAARKRDARVANKALNARLKGKHR